MPQSFIIMLDALRYDYLKRGCTPFLSELAARSIHAEVVETFAFQTRPAYFAGLDPNESDICHLFQFDPASSPFFFLRPFTALLSLWDRYHLPSGLLRRVIRLLAKQVEIARNRPACKQVISTEQIPLQLLPYFSLSEKEFTDSPDVFPGHKTIFDLMREKGRNYNWIGYPRHYCSTDSIVKAFQQSAPAQVNYLHFAELDMVGHRFGPNSKEISDSLTRLDNELKKILSPTLDNGGSVVVFGDHGMVEVRNTYDLESQLENLPLKFGTDFFYFLDSTQARFWFKHEKARELVSTLLSISPVGHILSKEEQEKFGINFAHRRYGDLVFILDGPDMIHPSFFARKQIPRGMHGYPVNVRDNNTAVIAYAPGISATDLGVIEMTKIYDLICSTLQLS